MRSFDPSLTEGDCAPVGSIPGTPEGFSALLLWHPEGSLDAGASVPSACVSGACTRDGNFANGVAPSPTSSSPKLTGRFLPDNPYTSMRIQLGQGPVKNTRGPAPSTALKHTTSDQAVDLGAESHPAYLTPCSPCPRRKDHRVCTSRCHRSLCSTGYFFWQGNHQFGQGA